MGERNGKKETKSWIQRKAERQEEIERDRETERGEGEPRQAEDRDRHLESRKGHWWSQKQRAKAQLLWARRKKERRKVAWKETGERWAKSPVWREQGGRRGGELGFTAVPL